jgi:MSHA biogenesis protein MshJ
MKALWLKLAGRYNVLVERERWMLAVCILGSILFLGWSSFIEPAMKRAALAERSGAEQHKQLADLKAQIVALQSPGQDPDVAARAELDGLKKALAELASRFAAMEGTLVPPERMPGLLENLIGRNSGLRLLSLRTLPVTPVLDKPAAKTPEGAVAADKPADAALPAAGLYKHGVEIRLEGGYQELASYLARLEQSPQKLLWSNVSLSADKHPKLVLTLTVFTLSLDRIWLIV